MNTFKTGDYPQTSRASEPIPGHYIDQEAPTETLKISLHSNVDQDVEAVECYYQFSIHSRTILLRVERTCDFRSSGSSK